MTEDDIGFRDKNRVDLGERVENVRGRDKEKESKSSVTTSV